MAAWRLLKDIQLNYFLGYIVIVLVLVLLKVVRLRWFLSYIGHRLTLKAVYQSVIEPGFYGMVTPARLGEFSKVSYLIRFGLTRKQAWGVVLMERLVDFLVLLFASTVGGLYFFVWRGRQVEWSVTLFLALFFALYYGLSKIGIVFNTDVHTGPGQHWFALFCDIRPELDQPRVTYFDSYSQKPERQIRTLMKRWKEEWAGSGVHSKPMLTTYNKTRHQFKDSECGIYCLYFHYCCLTKVPMDQRIPDEVINVFRRLLFRAT